MHAEVEDGFLVAVLSLSAIFSTTCSMNATAAARSVYREDTATARCPSLRGEIRCSKSTRKLW